MRKIAGMDKEAFIRFLGKSGVSIFRFDDNDEFMERVKGDMGSKAENTFGQFI